MAAQIREYERVPSVERALALLERTTVTTAPLIPRPRVPEGGFPPASALVDLQELPWRYVRVDSHLLRIGAATPLQDLVESPAVRAIAGGILSAAAELAAPQSRRTLATLAGAVEGAADGPPEVLLALLALGARGSVQGKGEERGELPLREYRPSARLLLAEVLLDLGTAPRAGLARVARTPLDQAIVAAVAVAAGQTVRVAVAGASVSPILAVETGGDGQSVLASLVEQVAAQVDPVGDYRGSAAYRRAMAEVLARRALAAAVQ
jgi:CO/xanthine dehydrogenase FAD-binding subunit